MSATVAIPVWLLALLVLAIVALSVIVWSVKRRSSPRLSGSPTHSETLTEQTLEGLVHATAVGGNRVELLQNGAFFDALFADLDRATTTINFETFLAREGQVTRELTDRLIRKREDGVEVRLMLDGSGGRKFGDADIERLTAAGCVVRKFHPFVPSNLGRLNQRTHRKIVIIDGTIGYVGGHCLVDTWLGDAEDEEHYRDITARVEGPVVNQLQSAFSDNWMEETGELLTGRGFFPVFDDRGGAKAHAVYASPTGAPSSLEVLHYVAIDQAKRSITIQNPYFLPDPPARDALIAAVRRGVEVRVMIPSADATDAKFVSHASHHHYGSLLEGGVRIFEYERTLLHQKIFVIDRTWASVGSANFDDRSFEINDEISLVIWDPGIAARLEEIFEEDAQHATEQKLDDWSNRSVIHRLIDGGAYLVNEQL